MKTIHVILDYSPLPTVEVIDFGEHVESNMKSNPLFPTPDVPMSLFHSSLQTLKDKHALALNGNKTATEGVTIARKAFEKTLKLNALYVDRIADGDEEVIASSGYKARKQPAPANRPEFRVLAGNAEGSVILIRKAVKRAASYVWQRAANPLPSEENLWIQTGISTQAKCVIENLESGTKYWFRVAAVTRQGQQAWCEPIMKVVP